MTENEQRIAIAEFCGWQWYRIPGHPGEIRTYRCLFLPAIHEIDQVPVWMVKADGTEAICNMAYMQKEGLLPDYLHDLNAMHEIEVRLSHSDFRIYLGFLNHTRIIPHLMNMDEVQACWNAKASQRAEALLRTIGKWNA